MEIIDVDVVIVHIPYEDHIVWGSREADGDDYVILRLQTDTGEEGCAQSLHWSDNYQTRLSKATVHTIEEVLKPILTGHNPVNIEQIRNSLDQIRDHDEEKTLVECALCDLRAKTLNIPVWKYLGGWTEKVPVSWLINKGSAEEMFESASWAIENHGFNHLKIKVGDDPVEDVEGVKRIHDQYPDLFSWIDANSSYTWDEALWVADQLRDKNVKMFEDPNYLYANERTRQMVQQCNIPVMWHKGMNSADDVEKAVTHGAEAVNLKVRQLGYAESKRLVEKCESAGVSAGVGTTSETGLASMESLHFRGALRSLEGLPAENSFFLKLEEDIIEETIEIKDGFIELPSDPGFGVTIDDDKIEEYRIN